MEAAGRSTRSGARATSVDCRTSLAPSSKLFAAEPRVALPRLSATGASKPTAQPKAASATPAPELELLRATIQRLEEQNCAMKEQNAQLLEQITGMCQLLQEEKEEAKRREEKLEAQMEKLAAAHQRDRDVLNSLLAAKVGGGQPSGSPRQLPTPLPRRSSAQPQQQQQQQQPRQIRTDERYKPLKDHVVLGRRTSKALLRLTLSRKANAQYMLQQVRAIVGSAGVCRHVTEMASVVIHDVDPLAREDDLTSLIDSKFESGAGIVSTTMNKMTDGTQRAYVRLPAKFAKELDGTKIKLGFCISKIRAAPPTPRERVRCYRCLELEHVHTLRRCGAHGKGLHFSDEVPQVRWSTHNWTP
uniref:uncharacterized protein LOC125906849 n=1 Tax=Anopheles coluzzii TaxID=1518534 RepID=UPI0020FF8873|nr:uncharacterized protein LOC125906849 [Anopheles coluzzii]